MADVTSANPAPISIDRTFWHATCGEMKTFCTKMENLMFVWFYMLSILMLRTTTCQICHFRALIFWTFPHLCAAHPYWGQDLTTTED
jgi:hypothetical protein